MEDNFLIDIANKKAKTKEVIQKAYELGCINADERQSFSSKIDNNVLTLGVIGQMKCGKSTFLNSFIFGEDLLPAATTPMTASLTVITYGPSKKIEAEFYTQKEWEELKLTSVQVVDEDDDEVRISKIKAAQELVAKSHLLGNQLGGLLGTKKEDSLNNLVEYVGAEGKYIGITKSVTVFYPEEYLKGVRVVDTPGFNDPVVSREERTNEFLRQADVAVMIVSAGRPFDATDRDIIFNKLSKVGVGKFVLGINKFDLQIEEETKESMIDYVSKEFREVCSSCEYGNNELFDNVRPHIFSSQMALLSKIPIDQIFVNQDYKEHYERLLRIFGLTSQQELLIESNIDGMNKEVRNILLASKVDVITRKLCSLILATCTSKIGSTREIISQLNNELKVLNLSPEELENGLKEIVKVKTKVAKQLRKDGSTLKRELDNLIDSKIEELKTLITDEGKDKMLSFIEDYGRFNSRRKLKSALRRHEDIFTRKIDRFEKKISKEINTKIIEALEGSISKLERIFTKYLEDFDTDDYIENLKNSLHYASVSDTDSDNASQENGSDEFSLKEFMFDVVLGALICPINIPFTIIDRLSGSWKDEYAKAIDDHFDSIDTNEMKQDLKAKSRKLSEKFSEIGTSLLNELELVVTERKNNVEDSTNKINEVESRIKSLEVDLREQESNYEIINAMSI